MVSVWEKTTTNVGAIFNYLHFKENFQFAVCQSQLPFQHATFYFHFTRTLTIRFTVSDTQKEYYSFLIGLSLRSNITGTIPWLQSCDQNWLRLDCFPDGKVCNRKYIFFSFTVHFQRRTFPNWRTENWNTVPVSIEWRLSRNFLLGQKNHSNRKCYCIQNNYN